MKKRRGYNPKRRIASTNQWPPETRKDLSDRATYTGNPEHKQNPGDYGLTPPSKPRPDKTICDGDRLILREEAQSLLEEGLLKGIVSEQTVGNWPQNVWAVDDDDQVFEAQLENKELGTYHGYPMPNDDPFGEVVLKEWNNR